MKRRLFLGCCLAVMSLFATVSAQTFRHPGLLHSEEDFENIKARIAAGDEQTLAALEALQPISNWGGMWAVNEHISRGISGSENYMNAYRNAARAYQLALRWKITGDEGTGDAAIEILNAYRMYNKSLGGNTNMSLIPGFIGYQFVNAAEIMRDYEKWSKEDFELFKQYMIDVWFTLAQDFLERRHDTVTREQNWYHYHSNWGLGNAVFCVSLGVLCDMPDIYNYGMYWIKEGPGNESLCVTSLHPEAFGSGLCGYGWGLIPWFHKDERGPLGYYCQMQESGRDQGHSMAALGLLSYALQTAYNQGDNAFCNLYNPLIKGMAGTAMVAGAAEYVAAYNNGIDDLPYTQNWWMGGLNGTGRGQWRPIWQLFINHYQNRMGIAMPQCVAMHNTMGIERGGGSYGNNSGGYDHTGFGDLMHTDTPVAQDMVPTVISPMISGVGISRRYAEIRNVTPGTVLYLSAMLPTGETDTGMWEWEDGSTGQQRQITADKSALYRLTYTNSKGVKSTQLFSIAVRGEGIKATLSATATYNGQVIEGSDILMGQGRPLTITTAYSNWNYIESEEWFDEDGNLLGKGGSYTFTLNDDQTHKLVFKLTNQSGVVIEREFNIIPNKDDLTNLLSDPDCEELDAWNKDVEDFKTLGTLYSGFNGKFIERHRAATEDEMTCWGQDRFNISSTVSGLTPGKYELGAMVIATQQSKSGADSKNYVKDVYLYAGGANTAVSSQDGVPEYHAVQVYVGEDGTLTYGAKNMTNQNKGFSKNGMNWFAMDNYILLYKGDADLTTDLAAMREEVASVSEESLPTGLYARVEEARMMTGNDIATAVTLQNVLGDVRLVSSRFDEFNALYLRYKAHVEDNAVADEALLAALTEFENVTTAEAFFDAYEGMTNAWQNYLPNAKASVDLTTELADADFPYSGDDVWYDNATNWLTESSGGNFRIFPIDGSDTQRGDAVSENMLERWCTGNFYAGERVIYQTISGLPIGGYTFGAAVQKGVQSGAIEIFANDGVSYVKSVLVMRKHTVDGESLDGKLNVGLRAATGNACQWVTISDVELTYHSPVMMLERAIAEADTLNYGEDTNGGLQTALTAAKNLLDEGDAMARMEAYHSLVEAIAQYRLNNASETYPVDMSNKIMNGSLDLNVSHWAVSVADAAYPKFHTGVAEFWHTTFTMGQTLTNLPVGNYRVSLQVRTDVGSQNDGCYLYARSTGGAETKTYATDVTVQDGTDITLHLGQNAAQMDADSKVSKVSLDAFSTDGKLTIGAACDRSDIWCVLNNFTIEYMGFGANDLLKNWADLVEQANKINRDSIPAAVETQLDEAVNVDVQTVSADSLSKALVNLSAVVENSKSVMAVYMRYQGKKATVETIAENSIPNYSSSLATFKKTITSADAAVEAATTIAEINGAYDDLETARQTYVVGATPINGIGFDLTFKIENPSGAATGGWLTDGVGNFSPMTNAEQNGEYTGNVFFEKWDLESYVFKGGSRPIYQTVSLPNGNYTLTMAAFRMNQFGTTYADGGICAYFNTDKVEVTSEVLNYYTINGVVSSRKAEIGLVSGEENTANWVGLADVRLMFYGTSDVEMSENDAELTVQDGLYCNATIEQSLSADGWNLVTLPFDLTSAQVKKAFADVKALDAVEVVGSACNLMFVDARTMTAGVPYLVKVQEAVSSLIYEKVRINAESYANGAVTLTFGDATMRLVGTPNVTTLDGYNVFKYNGTSFFKAEIGEEVKGFGGYVVLDGVNDVHMMNVYVDGEQVSVQNVQTEPSDDLVSVYSISGILLRNNVLKSKALESLPAGLYIIDGKKYTVK